MKKQFLLYGYSSPTDGTYFYEKHLFTQNKDFRTEEHYTQYREVGFNAMMIEGNAPYYGETWETSQAKKTMDTAYKAGVKQIILYDKRIFDCSEEKEGLIGEGKRFASEKELDDFIRFCIKDYKNHPAFMGIMLVDEPRWFQILALSQVVKAVKRVAPTMFIQNNILPYYAGHADLFVEDPSGMSEAEAYRQYVQNYLQATQMPYLMYDSYPLRLVPKDGYFIRHEHLFGLQIASEVVKKFGVDFYFVCQTQAFYAHNKIVYRAPNEAEMRWQINCVLAFGIKSIGYFTYWRKQRNSIYETYVDGASFMTQDGRKTPLYFAVQKIHGELAQISDYLLDCDFECSSYYTDLQTPVAHLQQMKQTDVSAYVELEGDGKTSAVITVLTHRPTGDKVVCVFNANDPRGEIREACRIGVKLRGGKAKRTFSLKMPTCGEIQGGNVLLQSGDSVFIVLE